jgi:hypothetical protein
MRRVAALTVVAMLLLIPTRADARDCDRACLRGFVTEYLTAMVAHDPSRLRTAKTVRFTEDSVEKRLGEGLWQTASALGSFRQDILDVRQGVAGSYAIIEAQGSPVMLALRLTIVDDEVTQVETLVVRNMAEGLIFRPEGLKTPSAAMNVEPAPAQRASREDAIRIAELYPMGLRAGSFITVDVPFAPGAYRLEGGQLMAGPGCTFMAGCENIKTERVPTLSSITWQVVAVDEDLGIVWLWENFGRGSVRAPGMSLVTFEAFKVYGGQIHAAEAIMKQMPDGTGRGW